MIDAYELYQDSNDRINKEEGGYMSVELFNRYSWIAQLRLLDWLSGSVEGAIPPDGTTQKNRDWISDFITPYPKQVENGMVAKPSDYYLWQTGYKINGTIENTCDEDAEEQFTIVPNTSIQLLDNGKFDLRVDTYIKSLKPTVNKAICKVVGRNFIFDPADMGSIGIEYIRYPAKAILVMTVDPIYNDEVYDINASTPFEWQEYARPLLISYVANEFFAHIKDGSGLQVNSAIGKLSRQ